MNVEVKHTQPEVTHREAMPYAGIRVKVHHSELDSGIIPQLHDEVLAWLEARGTSPSGAPFLRYYVIDMAEKMDIELSWFTDEVLEGDDRVNTGELPAGQYASLVYTDVTKGIAGNGVLIDWAQQQGLEWDRWDDPNGDAFRCRYETFITDPADEPDMTKWETEVAIKLADG